MATLKWAWVEVATATLPDPSEQEHLNTFKRERAYTMFPYNGDEATPFSIANLVAGSAVNNWVPLNSSRPHRAHAWMSFAKHSTDERGGPKIVSVTVINVWTERPRHISEVHHNGMWRD